MTVCVTMCVCMCVFARARAHALVCQSMIQWSQPPTHFLKHSHNRHEESTRRFGQFIIADTICGVTTNYYSGCTCRIYRQQLASTTSGGTALSSTLAVGTQNSGPACAFICRRFSLTRLKSSKGKPIIIITRNELNLPLMLTAHSFVHNVRVLLLKT